MSFIIIVVEVQLTCMFGFLNLHIHFYYSKITVVDITHAFHCPYRILQKPIQGLFMIFTKKMVCTFLCSSHKQFWASKSEILRLFLNPIHSS